MGERPEKDLNKDRQDYDVHPVVMGKAVRKFEALQKGLGNDIEPAVVNHLFQVGVSGT